MDKTGIVLEDLGFNKSRVKVDGSGTSPYRGAGDTINPGSLTPPSSPSPGDMLNPGSPESPSFMTPPSSPIVTPNLPEPVGVQPETPTLPRRSTRISRPPDRLKYDRF